MALAGGDAQVCVACGQAPRFELRAGGRFGWGNKADAELMRAGLSYSRPPRIGFDDGRIASAPSSRMRPR